MSDVDSKLNELVNEHPQLYQPIYGHNEWDDKPLRSCQDRLQIIKKVYDDLSCALQRPLRVLDLGCAQGFFSLHIASWGGDVTGVDFLKKNIALGEFLASEHPDYKIRFIRAKFEEFIVTVKNDEYDLVLCLSLLHNVAEQIGMDTVRNLMTDLDKKIGVGLFEFALKNARNALAFPNIPEDYRDYLPSFSFIRELSYSDHRDKNGVKRPLCFVSNKFAWFENLGILKIDNISFNVHKNLDKKDVICFHCGDKFIKYFNLRSELSKDQSLRAKRELEFLKVLGGQNGLPRLLATHEEKDKIGKRLFIVREKINGVTLEEKLKSGEEFDRWDVIKQALQWMNFFVSKGYYNTDFQPQNFVYALDGKLYPIDYERMRSKPAILKWPYRLSLFSLIFINKVLASYPEDKFLPAPVLPSAKLKKHLSQKQYQQILTLKDSENFFEELYKILFEEKAETMLSIYCNTTELEDTSNASYNIAELEILMTSKYFLEKIDKLTQILKEQQTKITQLEKIVNKVST